EGVGRADDDAQLTADAVAGARHPRQRTVHLQALRRADLDARAARSAARLVEQRQLGRDHERTRLPPTGLSNPATTSGSISAGWGSSITKLAPRSQARPASAAWVASPTTTVPTSGNRDATRSSSASSNSRLRPMRTTSTAGPPR